MYALTFFTYSTTDFGKCLMVRIQDMTNPVLMASTTAMFLLRRLVGINTPHIRVLQDNHTYQEFEIGRVPSRL